MTLALAHWPLEEMSPAEQLASLSEEQRSAVLAELTPGQQEAIKWEWSFWQRPDQRPPDDFSVWVVLGGRGKGKALDADTPLPTPTGWTTMHDVRVGDLLLDDSGRPCRVTFATGLQYGRPCSEIAFSDGSGGGADDEHRWLTSTHAERKSARRGGARQRQVRTTANIRATLRQGRRRDLNHSIPLAAALALPEAALPIPPYTLGAWLGDGTSRGAEITTADPEILAGIEAEGFLTAYSRPAGGASSVYSIDKRPVGRDRVNGRLLSPGGLRSKLAALGVWGSKHIPATYLRASEDQRRALLAGLMDTDGTISAAQQAEFCSTTEQLAEGVFELVTSLGMKSTVTKGTATLNGVEIGPKWRIRFRPTVQVFRLSRKAARWRPPGAQARRLGHRMVTGVRAVPSRAVRCLTVDSPSSLFLAGRAMVPTHNTRQGSEWARQKGPKHAEGLLIGANPRDARDLMLEGRSGILTVSPPWERPEYEPTKLLLRWPNGAIAHVRSAEDPGGIRGLSVEWIWADEIVKWRYLQETWDQSRLAIREGVKPQTVVTTTPMPLPLIKKLVKGSQRGVVVAPRVSTYRNAANLAPDFVQELLDQYEGTRLGRQELHAELLEDVKGALWNSEMVEAALWPKDSWTENEHGLLVPGLPKMRRVAAVDPSGSETGDECGIVVAGASAATRPSTGYVLADYSMRGDSESWGKQAVEAYYDHNCEAVVAEVNYGGEMVERVIHATPAHGGYPTGESVNVVVLRAGKGQSKYERAIPIAGMFQQNITTPHKRVFLVGNFPVLVGQLTSWVPAETATPDSPASKWSPDRLDAMVWGLLYLLVIERRRQGRSHAKTLIGG